MIMRKHHSRAASRASHARQRGVVLLFSLIALAIMLIVAVALVRSFNNSLFTAGNIGFKRDLQNQSELAVVQALALFNTGALSTPAGRANNQLASNYSATILATNAEGIPNVLQSDSTFANAGFTGADLPPGPNPTVRFVIDRLCATTGDETAIVASTSCRLGDYPVPAGSGLDNLRSADRTTTGGKGAAPQSVLYRVSIKVTGPRNTQSFFQSTFTVPSS